MILAHFNIYVNLFFLFFVVSLPFSFAYPLLFSTTCARFPLFHFAPDIRLTLPVYFKRKFTDY